jgi:phage terminase large subunit GpA-like protein
LAELFPWKRMPKKGSRGREYHWDCPTGMRDEAGDCTRYAYAALQLVSRRYNRQTMWDQLAAQLATGKAETAAVQRRKGNWLSR